MTANNAILAALKDLTEKVDKLIASGAEASTEMANIAEKIDRMMTEKAPKRQPRAAAGTAEGDDTAAAAPKKVRRATNIGDYFTMKFMETDGNEFRDRVRAAFAAQIAKFKETTPTFVSPATKQREMSAEAKQFKTILIVNKATPIFKELEASYNEYAVATAPKKKAAAPKAAKEEEPEAQKEPKPKPARAPRTLKTKTPAAKPDKSGPKPKKMNEDTEALSESGSETNSESDE